MLTNKGPQKEPEPDQPSHQPTVAEEIIGAIRLAKEEYKSCEVVTNLRLAQKFLYNLGYKPVPFRKGILLNFEKANIYIRDR